MRSYVSFNVQAENKPVGITADLMSVTVTHHGQAVEIMRNQDNANTVIPAFARTSRPGLPFCIQPMSRAPGVETLGELEVLDDVAKISAGDSSIILADSRTPDKEKKSVKPEKTTSAPNGRAASHKFSYQAQKMKKTSPFGPDTAPRQHEAAEYSEMNMRAHSFKMIAVLAFVIMVAGLASCGGGGSSSAGGESSSAGGESQPVDGGNQLTIMPPTLPLNTSNLEPPDLELWALSVSNSSGRTLTVGDSVTAGASLTLLAGVRNAGGERSAATTLRYYQSTNSTVSSSDTQIGMVEVGPLYGSGASNLIQSLVLHAPATAGMYYYGACVDAVPRESNTTYNCKSSGAVNVTSP